MGKKKEIVKVPTSFMIDPKVKAKVLKIARKKYSTQGDVLRELVNIGLMFVERRDKSSLFVDFMDEYLSLEGTNDA